MKATEAVILAIDKGDARAAGALADTFRRKGRTYAQVLAFVRTVRPNVTAAEWDALLYEADTMDSGDRE